MQNEIINQQWIYRKQPQTVVDEDHYELQTEILSTELAHHEVLIKAKYISVDPYMRIQQSKKPTWEAPHPLHSVQQGSVVGQVIESKSPLFKEGDWALAYTGWQTYAITHASQLVKLNPDEASVTTALSVLGMPGRTAWFGLTEAGKPKAGETIVVSGAAGAVGSLVSQFAKLHGMNVIAIAGSDAKCHWLKNDLGVDHAINYQTVKNADGLLKQLKLICDGVDIYFDNVGGWITDTIIPLINRRARIVICGQISQYNGGLDDVEMAPRFLHHLLYQRATIQGILARDYTHRMDEMYRIVCPLLRNKQLKYQETYVHGFEKLPEALGMLFSGKNVGKLIVAIED